jgi:hypothetical protein
LRLHVEQAGAALRFYNPATQQYLATRKEKLAESEAENARLRRELDALRRRLPES